MPSSLQASNNQLFTTFQTKTLTFVELRSPSSFRKGFFFHVSSSTIPRSTTMVISTSKSTSRRETHGSSAKHSVQDSRKKTPLRRSKSVSAVTRSCPKFTAAPTVSDSSVEQFANKRDNPLFCSSSALSPEFETSANVLKDDGDCCSTRKGRSVLRSFSYGNQASRIRNQSARSLSRVGSGERLRMDSREHYDNFENNDATSNGHGVSEEKNNLQTWRNRHPVSDHCSASSTGSLDDGISTASLSELEETTMGAPDHPSARGGVGCIYETVRSEVQRAVSEMTSDLKNAIWRKNLTLASSDIVEMCPDTLQLVSDIRIEYETKLKESHERARKLRADLAVEEQREQEIGRILNEINSDENSAPQKFRPRRKLSIERLKMSRRLAEDAMSYFDECVSISTLDSSFSSTEDQQPSSLGTILPLDGNRPCSLNGHLNRHEEFEIQSQYSVSAPGSGLPTTSRCSSNKDTNLSPEGKKCEKLSKREAAESGGFHDFKTYIKQFEKEPKRSHKNAEVSTSFDINDYDLDNSTESLLFDTLFFKNRIESGSLLLCDIRTF